MNRVHALKASSPKQLRPLVDGLGTREDAGSDDIGVMMTASGDP
jgi:hypothetical protein